MAGLEPRPVGGVGRSIPDSGRPDTIRQRPHRVSSAAQRGRPGQEDAEAREVQNQRAVEVLARVKEKLTGRDFKSDQEALRVELQVDKLIREATSLENLCQHYIGWCSFW
jgi:FKBP12-rapamycin complex-associated protein